MNLNQQEIAPVVGAIVLTSLFVLFKIPHLDLPYFWDASWVYAPAIFEMVEQHPSLIPNTITTDLTRGHPLFFHFSTSIWAKIFGITPTSLHSFMLILSLGILFLVFIISRFYWNSATGFLALSILISQEIFLVQSSLLLPEVLLTLTILLSLWFYSKRQWYLFSLSATLCLLTKESGVVFIGTLFFYHQIFQLSIADRRKRMIDSLYFLIPFVILSVHFIWLKLTEGWFFYPLHLSYFKTTFQSFHQDIRFIWDQIWIYDGRLFISIATGICLILKLKFKKIWHRVLPPLIIYFAYITFYREWPQPEYWLKITILMVVSIGILMFFRKILRQKSKDRFWTSLFILYLLSFSFWCAYNVFTVRYLHSLIVFYSMFCAWGLSMALENNFAKIGLGVLIVYSHLFYFHTLEKSQGIKDVDLNYIDGIEVQTQLIKYCDSIKIQDLPIHASLLEKVAMQNKDLGYLQNKKPFSNVDLLLNEETQYALFTNIAFEPTFHKMDSLGFALIKRFEVNEAWGEVYMKTK